MIVGGFECTRLLTDTDWNKLRVASGAATDVPNALTQLSSSSERERENAYWRLDNEIVCQSDLYEAALPSIAYLICLLQHKVPYCRPLVYKLLFEIANGYAPPTVVVHTPSGPLPLEACCRQAIEKAMSIFQKDRLDPDIRVANAATELIDILEGSE